MRCWGLPVFAIAFAFVLVSCGGGASSPGSTGAVGDQRASAVSENEPADPTVEKPASPDTRFSPDSASLERLVFWDDSDSIIRLVIPDDERRLFEQLLASDDPAADKYLVALATSPNPYRLLVTDHLRDRFDSPPVVSVYAYPELFHFAAADETDAYIVFKHALYAGWSPALAELVAPDLARIVDAREVQLGGVDFDAIPPLDFPTYESAAQAASWLNGHDEIVGITVNGDSQAYPLRIIAWHEMVNDTIGGVPVTLAYCTLCGTAILYDGRVGPNLYRFGTSGLLYRSNKLMFDDQTRTLWNQFTGAAVWGGLVGTGARLASLPVTYTTWDSWLLENPETVVLSLETGFERDYRPGVAYAAYNSSADPSFNVPVADERLEPKEEVFVLRIGEVFSAYPTAVLAERGLVRDTIDGVNVVVVATADGRGGRAYLVGGVRFVRVDPEARSIVDADDRIWAIGEDGLMGPAGSRLERANGHNAFWFAVVNQTPNARLYEG